VDQPRAELLLFDSAGITRNAAAEVVPSSDLNALKRLGLTYLIHNHPVFLVAPPSHHFVVPSETHADVFFRIGSAMADGAAIDFLAYCCLPFFVDREVKHIYCDTGAISPVAYAINALRSRVPPGGKPVASVSSFGSYKGAPDFKFREVDRSVILISVSTSGGLARLLCESGNDIQDSDIVTLFTLYEPKGTAKVVCNLLKDESNPDGFDEVKNFRERDCPLCAEESTRIVISTEQFLPGRGTTESLIMRVSHSPKWLSPFLKQFVGTGVIRANYKSGDSNHATKEVFFNLQTFFADSEMLKIEPYGLRLWRTVDRVVPASLTRILCLNSPASHALAERIKQRLGPKWSSVEIVNHQEVLSNVDQHRKSSGATLVVAAAAASGRSLQAVSQLLRTIQTNGAITYLIGLARFPDKHAQDEVESNITYGDHPKEHGFFVIDHVFLPLVGSQTKTSWEMELDLIDRALVAPENESTQMALERRGQAIRKASETQGMSDSLFWGKINGQSLSLRPGFAFHHDFNPSISASQADVFFTIVAVLHNLRSERRSSESLFQHEYRRRVLSPICFDRFNDGVIQGSILRAAHPAELDYSIDERLSSAMWQILDTIFSSSTTQVGEAALEFLLAIALKRLKLLKRDLEKLKAKFGGAIDHPIARLLWTIVGQ